MNLTEIAGYIMWGFGAIFLLGGLSLGYYLYSDYSKKKKLLEEENKKKQKDLPEEEVSKFRSAGKKRALIIDKDKKSKISKDSLVKSVFGVKEEETVGFAPKASSLEDIAAGLSDSPVTTNRFRAPIDERDIAAMEQLKTSTPAPKAQPIAKPELPVTTKNGGSLAPPPRISNRSNDSGIAMPFGENRPKTGGVKLPPKTGFSKPLPPPPSKLN